MEKIICNNKIKKLIIMLFIFMLLFNFIFPSLVYAADSTMTYNEWLEKHNEKHKEIL